jgi:SAM-dependent methyltransferase
MSEQNAPIYDTSHAHDYNLIRVPFAEDPTYGEIDAPSKAELWIDQLFYSRLGYGGVAGQRLVEVGCGNGRWTIIAAREIGYATVGIDLSRAMLQQARINDKSAAMEPGAYDPASYVSWVQAAADQLPLEDNSVDVVLVSHAHHLFKGKAPAAFREFGRVLHVGGLVIDRFQPREDLGDDFEHSHSPALTKIDNTRIPTRDTAEGWARAAGLGVDSVRLARLYFSRDPIGYRINRFESRVVSSVRALGKTAHRAALQEMRHVADIQPVKVVSDQPITTMKLIRERGSGDISSSEIAREAKKTARNPDLTSEQIKAMTDIYTIMYAQKMA